MNDTHTLEIYFICDFLNIFEKKPT